MDHADIKEGKPALGRHFDRAVRVCCFPRIPSKWWERASILSW
jgi:hypothetical protein